MPALREMLRRAESRNGAPPVALRASGGLMRHPSPPANQPSILVSRAPRRGTLGRAYRRAGRGKGKRERVGRIQHLGADDDRRCLAPERVYGPARSPSSVAYAPALPNLLLAPSERPTRPGRPLIATRATASIDCQLWTVNWLGSKCQPYSLPTSPLTMITALQPFHPADSLVARMGRPNGAAHTGPDCKFAAHGGGAAAPHCP